VAAKDFLGIGWRFPVALDAGGEIAMASYEDDIAQAIRIVLRTAPGERVMRPSFGCGIHDLVFATVSTATLGRVEDTVREALVRWEPRIDVERVTVSLDALADGRLLVNVDYRVRATNNRFNLVYPFYLTERP